MTPKQREVVEQAIAFCQAWPSYGGKELAEALQAELRNAQHAAPVQEPVAYLWQHGETGRTRIVTHDTVTDCDASWQLIGPLYLAAQQPAPPADVPMQWPKARLRWPVR